MSRFRAMGGDVLDCVIPHTPRPLSVGEAERLAAVWTAQAAALADENRAGLARILARDALDIERATREARRQCAPGFTPFRSNP